MLTWTVTAVQILAILVCPLTCVSGHACCGADEMMAVADSSSVDQRTSSSVDPQTASCDRCCCERESEEEQNTPPAAPGGKNTCQGVCGGAIFEKPCELPVETSLFAVLPVANDQLPIMLFDCQPTDVVTLFYGSGNYGRSLRTRHASFLC